METETWRPIPGFPHYEVSDLGQVRSYRLSGGRLRTEPRLLSPCLAGGTGYPHVTIRNDAGRGVSMLVHTLVLLAFAGLRPPGYQAAHEDGCRINNRLGNLSWKTPADNAADKRRHGTKLEGETHGMAILTRDDVLALRGRRAAGETIAALAREYKVNYSTARLAIIGKNWASV